MFYYCYLCLFSYTGVQHILCYIFRRLVFPLLPVSLDCLFLIVTSVFSDVNLLDIYTYNFSCNIYLLWWTTFRGLKMLTEFSI